MKAILDKITQRAQTPADKLWRFYFKEYKKLLAIPLIILILVIASFAVSKITTGEFFQKGVSLKGGYSATIETNQDIGAESIAQLISESGFESVEVRTLKDSITNAISGYDLSSENEISMEFVKNFFETNYAITLEDSKISLGYQSPTIANTFFKQAVIALLLAFTLMGVVVLYYFRNPVSSFSIIFSTASDVLAVIATMNLLGMKMSIASLGALLMIIAYSADSDVLLATNILKRKDAPLEERMKRAIKTEITMAAAALSVYTLMFVFSDVYMIKEIAIVLLLGIIFDMINTWLGNATLQRIIVGDKE